MSAADRSTFTKSELKIFNQYNFVKRTDEKSLYRKIHDLVDLAKKVRQEELAQKRERLRSLLSREEKEFEDEYIAVVQAKVTNDVRDRQERLVLLKQEKSQEMKEFVQLKKIQQSMNNCDDIRGQVSHNVMHDTKICQLIQIEDKRRKALQDKEHDRVWEDIGKKISDAQKRKEECDELRRHDRILQDREFLRQQMQEVKDSREQEHREQIEERIRIDAELKAQFDLEKQQTLAGEVGKRLQQARVLKGQLLEAMELKKKRIENDIAFDRLFEQAIKAQFEREKCEIAGKVDTLRETTLTYLQYLSEFKNERRLENIEHEKALKEFQRLSNARKDKLWRETKEKKAVAAKKAHEELLAQICENKTRRMKEERDEWDQALLERKMFEEDLRKDKEKELSREIFALNYGKELMDQVEAIKQFEAEQKRKFEDDLNKASEDDLHCEMLAQKFISGKIDYLKAHPNWNLISCSCLNV